MEIKLKRSDVLDGNVAKKPLASELVYGELAVNYSATDPAIFLKTSTDEVVQIAGSNASGGDGSVPTLAEVLDQGNFSTESIFLGGTASDSNLQLNNTGNVITTGYFRSNKQTSTDVVFETELASTITFKAMGSGSLALGGTISAEPTESEANIFLNAQSGKITGNTLEVTTATAVTFEGALEGNADTATLADNVTLPQSETPPASAVQGNLWYNSSTGRLFYYYEDTDSSQWVEASPESASVEAGSPTIMSASRPTTRADGSVLVTGDLWWSTTSDPNEGGGTLYVYYQDENSSQWVSASPPVVQDVAGSFLMLNASNGPVTGLCSFSNGISVTSGDTYFAGDTFFISNDRASIDAGTVIGAYCNTNGVRVSSRNSTSASNHLKFNNPNGSVGAIATKDSDIRLENQGAGSVILMAQTVEGLAVTSTGTIQAVPTYNNESTNTTNYLRITSSGNIQRSTSSRRYKDNIRDCTLFDGTASTTVKQLQPRTWEDYKTGQTTCGFIAEELYKLGGEHMVDFSSWKVGEGEYRVGNGATPVTKDNAPLNDEAEVVDNINDRSLVILLTKALQEALTRIEALENA